MLNPKQGSVCPKSLPKDSKFKMTHLEIIYWDGLMMNFPKRNHMKTISRENVVGFWRKRSIKMTFRFMSFLMTTSEIIVNQ